MSDAPAARGGPDGAHQDPMAADRRTLVIAAAAMVVLVALGVVSAALFTGSACADIEPDPVDARAAGTDLSDVVRQAFPDLDEGARTALVDGVSSLAEVLGPVTGTADVGDVERIAPLGPAVAAFGPVTTVLAPGGADVRATAAFGDAAVVGDGSTTFSLALANELTGQVDAIQPLDTGLRAVGSCLDTAIVNVPFAFHLDAGGGELLLFRSDEDGGDPELQLRGSSGAVWSVPLEVAIAPPGLLGERISGRLGGDLAVTARRTAPGEAAAAVTAVERDGGAQRWTLSPEDLPDLGEGPVWVEVVGVGDEAVVLAMARDEARDERILVGLDPADGTIRWSDGEPARIGDVVVVDGSATELVDQRIVRAFDPVTGEREELGVAEADRYRVVASPRGDLLVALGEGGLLVHGSDGVMSLDLGASVRDVAVGADGAVMVLVVEGDDGVAVTFGS